MKEDKPHANSGEGAIARAEMAQIPGLCSARNKPEALSGLRLLGRISVLQKGGPRSAVAEPRRGLEQIKPSHERMTYGVLALKKNTNKTTRGDKLI